MPFAENAGARLYWKSDGDRSRPPLLLLNSIGTDMGAWDRALPFLLPYVSVLRMDARGHGASDAPSGDYSLDLCAQDALAVLDAAGVSRAAVCGVSLGGMVAMGIALREPDRVDALVLICTSPKMDSQVWDARIAAIATGGTAAIADAAIGRFVSPAFARSHPEVTGGLRASLLAQSAEGYLGCAAAIRDMDLRARLSEITAPTLVIGGERDVSTPFAQHGRLIADAIPHAEAARLDTSHLAQVETPSALAGAVVGFLRRLANGSTDTDAADQLYRTGLETRRQVLGDAWVDRTLAHRTPFNSEFQAMITRIAWNEIWTRPGLDRRTRRLLVLAVTAALGRWEEFRLHVRSGLEQGGFTVEELKESLMQIAIYAGVPTANTAFGEAGEIVSELDARREV